jgi:hypothetical protein
MEDQLITARIKALMVASYTMAAVIGIITCAMVAGLFVSNELVDNEKVFGLLGYVMTSVVSAVAGSYATLMGMKGEVTPQEIPALSQTSSSEAPVSVSIVNSDDDTTQETFFAKKAEPELELTEVVEDDDDDMEPWEKYRNDLRYDANGDGVVDEADFPDWRNPER